MKTLPKMRKQKLVVREFAGELLVYDKKHHEAHCLNSTAALVWKHCDGRTSVTEISQRVAQELNADGKPFDERLVWDALDQFGSRHLLEEKLEVPAGMLNSGGLNRRQVLRALGVAAVALPLVTSLIAPTAQAAGSCASPSVSCTASIDCCSGLCSGGTCA